VFEKGIFDDIDLKVIEVDRYLHRYGRIKKNLKDKNLILTFQSCLERIFVELKNIPLTMLILYYRCRRRFFDFQPPRAVGWSGELYINHYKSVWKWIRQKLKKSDDIFIHAYCGIVKNENLKKANLSIIRFRKEYWNEVEKIMNSRSCWVGVHIRRTDHLAAINHSKTEEFIKKMKTISEEMPHVSFFLATDDFREEQRLKSIFGNKIVTQDNKIWGRANTAGMQSAVVDCLCLSRCEYILGSYTSVFSSFASRYGNKKLVVIKSI